MLYGYSGSPAYLNVSEKLFALFLEHASNAPTTLAATRRRGRKVVHVSPINLLAKRQEIMEVKNSFNLISYLLFCKSLIY